MSVQVQGPDGNTYQFPDGTDKAAAIGYFRRKGIGGKTSPSGPDFTSNAKGEGLYDMTGPSGSIKVPFSKAKDAISGGYSMNHQTLARYHDDVRGAQPDWRDKLTTPTRQSDTPVHAVEDVLGNIGSGGLGVILRPVDTVKGIANTFAHPIDTAVNLEKQAETAPLETIETGIGQAAAMGGATKATIEGVRAVPSTARAVIEGATGTTPGATKDLVRKTEAKNARVDDINARRAEADARRAAETERQNQEILRAAKEKAETDRANELRDYLRKKQTVNEQNSARQSVADRKLALERGVEHLDPELKSELEKTEDAVNAEANSKYAVLSSSLDPIEANPESLPQAYENAMDQIKGSDTEPLILKDIGKKIQQGETFTYRDLQGYRSELGRELRKGSLPGDVFHAYKGMQNVITDEMQRIADNHGMHDQFVEARDYYRRYAQTFLDRTSPVRKALNATERGATTKAFRGKDQSGVEALAQFNPELARRINTVRGYAEEAAKTRPSTIGPKPQPNLPAKTEFVAPKLKPVPEPKTPLPRKTLGTKDVQAAKEAGVHKVADVIRKRGTSIAVYVTGYRSLAAVARAAMGDVRALEQLPADVGEGIALVGGAHAFARMLESPRVIDLLTKPNARDLAQIPPEMRSGLVPVVEAAQQHGIQVSPLVIAAIGIGGPKTQQLRKLRDTFSQTAAQ